MIKNYFLIVSLVILYSCSFTTKDANVLEDTKLEVTDLGCKDGGQCLADHSCCAPEEE